MEALIHSANVIYLVSYTMREILWLRVFTVIAATCLIFYFYLQPEPLLAPIYWNLLFIVLNIYWIVRLLLERRLRRLLRACECIVAGPSRCSLRSLLRPRYRVTSTVYLTLR